MQDCRKMHIITVKMALVIVFVSAALCFGEARAQGSGTCSFQRCYDNCVQRGGGRTIIPAVSCSKICSKRCEQGVSNSNSARGTMKPTPALRKACGPDARRLC